MNLRRISKEKSIRYTFIAWLILSILTLLIIHFRFASFYRIDVPTHFFAGMVISAYIITFVENKNFKKAFLIALIPFLLWEFFEIFMAYIFKDGLIYRVFHESLENRSQDLVMDSLGFFAFVLVNNKILDKKK